MLSRQQKRRKENTVKVILGVVFLMFGCSIYLLFRSKSLNIYLWCRSLGLSQFIDNIRYTLQDCQLNDFVRFSLPDGLYCAAYILFIDAIWHDNKGIIKYIILSIVPIITVFSEVLQYFGIVKGTFDLTDLLCYLIPPLVYIVIVFIYNFKFNILKTN